MKDCFHEFFTLYEKGYYLEALQQIILDPAINYDHLTSQETLLQDLINYVDSAVFASLWATSRANFTLLYHLSREKNLQKQYQQGINLLKYEQQLLDIAIHPQNLPKEDNALPSNISRYFLHEQEGEEIPSLFVERMLIDVPGNYRYCLAKKIEQNQGWFKFKKIKSKYAELICADKYHIMHPWYPFTYCQNIADDIFDKNPDVIFLQPLSGDWKKIRNAKDTLFICKTKEIFFHMLQNADVVEAFCDKSNSIYILDIYPNQQFTIQNIEKIKKKPLSFTLTAANDVFEINVLLFMTALEKCLSQSIDEMQIDTMQGDYLYQIAKNMVFNVKAKRFGINRSGAHREKEKNITLADPHKGIVPKEYEKAQKIDLFGNKLEQLGKNAERIQKKLKIVHVVPQVVDGGHAPSRLLENLLLKYDKELFDVYLISTERLQIHIFEYPYNFTTSESSLERGAERFKKFHSNGVTMHHLDPRQTYERAARGTAELIKSWNIDIAIFHGPDSINCMCAQICQAPMRLLVEHGSQPEYPCFDGIIASNPTALKLYQQLYMTLGIMPYVLPFAIDVKAEWPKETYTKEQLGVSSGSHILTTISNHLEERVNREMSGAIAEILKRVPNTYYMPIGYIANVDRFKKPFKEMDVDHKVICLGEKEHPGYYVQAMDLYLNEFPLGSGVSILDALAGGCPIITMYNVDGEQASRYGGEFYGTERAVLSCKKEDYIELACTLLNDAKMHKEWSEHALKRYEEFSNPFHYVKQFEKIILDAYGKHWINLATHQFVDKTEQR